MDNKQKKKRKELICAVTAVVVLYMAMESIGITCPIKFITGISCAGCGMSRAWLAFLQLDMAKAFAKSLGVKAEFVEIDWDNKVLELDAKSIDCVWNGMTLTDEVTSAMECTNAYLNNAQVVVVPADVADQYQDEESLKDLSFAVEAGSAGEDQVERIGAQYTAVSSQADALMEVASGNSDAAAIDALMAAAMIGEGTGYADLTYTISLNNEEYGVGFRKGSDLAAALPSMTPLGEPALLIK